MKHISILVSAMLLTGCSGIRHEGREERAISQLTMTSENYVDTMHLHKGDFLRQMICNGKLRAMVKSELKSRHMDVLTSINVSNGTRVPKGALLAVTDETLYKRELEKAQRELEKARIDLADKLITMGYDSDGRGVPQDVMRRAEVTSGYYSAQYALETAETSLRDCYLTAPVSGVIANLEGHLHQKGRCRCRLFHSGAGTAQNHQCEDCRCPNRTDQARARADCREGKNSRK